MPELSVVRRMAEEGYRIPRTRRIRRAMKTELFKRMYSYHPAFEIKGTITGRLNPNDPPLQ